MLAIGQVLVVDVMNRTPQSLSQVGHLPSISQEQALKKI
jgi:hypothetical protein